MRGKCRDSTSVIIGWAGRGKGDGGNGNKGGGKLGIIDRM